MQVMKVILPGGTIVEHWSGHYYRLPDQQLHPQSAHRNLCPSAWHTVFQDTSTAASTLTLAVTLFQTPVTCDSTQFTFSVISSGVTSTEPISGTPACLEDQTLTSVNFTFSFPAPLHYYSPQSSISLQVSFADGLPLFSHGVWYQLVLESFDSTLLIMTETTIAPSPYLSGNLDVELCDPNRVPLRHHHPGHWIHLWILLLFY